MLDQFGVRTACGFEGVGQKGHAVESVLRIDPVGKGSQLSGSPCVARRTWAERVSKEAANESGLFLVLGNRGGGTEGRLLAP
jgi:hypothetical protein